MSDAELNALIVGQLVVLIPVLLIVWVMYG